MFFFFSSSVSFENKLDSSYPFTPSAYSQDQRSSPNNHSTVITSFNPDIIFLSNRQFMFLFRQMLQQYPFVIMNSVKIKHKQRPTLKSPWEDKTRLVIQSFIWTKLKIRCKTWTTSQGRCEITTDQFPIIWENSNSITVKKEQSLSPHYVSCFITTFPWISFHVRMWVLPVILRCVQSTYIDYFLGDSSVLLCLFLSSWEVHL